MGCVYCLTFPNGKSYVGLTTTPLARRMSRHRAEADHGTSRARVYRAWRKHGPPTVAVLAELPNEELAEAERVLICTLGTRIPHGYNQSAGGEGAYGVAVTVETRRKLSQANKGRRMSDDARRRMSEAKRGLKLSPETRAKMSAAAMGKPKAATAIAKTRAANIGRTHSDEARANISEGRRGIPRSPEASAKAAAKHRGRKNTPETIAKMREAALRRCAL